MKRSRSFQIFSVIFRERYREPTLELTIPTMLVSNIFLTAFYERSMFQLLGIVLAFVPMISVSETLAFALALRNIIFVTGDHISRGSIISFITLPIKRETLFLFIYVSDVILPYLFWTITTEVYSLLSNIPVPTLLLLTYTTGFFFTENLILLITLTFKSTGISTLLSIFITAGIFMFGGAAIYYEVIYKEYSLIYLTSFANPYVLWIFEALGTHNFTPQIISGLLIELFLSLFFLFVSYVKFLRLEV